MGKIKMQGLSRKTGIDAIGEVPWGTHFCQLYQNKADLIDTLVPYFREGLKNNEYCMWITGEPLEAEDAAESLTKWEPDFARYLARGQIEILSHRECFAGGDRFDIQRMLGDLTNKLQQVSVMGYDGLRLSANTCWLDKKAWQNFYEYETAFNNITGNCKILALCSYPIDKCSAREIIDITRNHEFIIIEHAGKWELVENTRRKRKNVRKQKLEVKSQGTAEVFKATNADSKNRFLSAIVESSDDAIIGKTLEGVITSWNKGAEKMYGYAEREVIGKNISLLVPSERSDEISQLLEKIRCGEHVKHLATVRQKKDGSKFPAIVTISPILNDKGKIIGASTIARDITQRKKYEEDLLRLNRELRAISDCNQVIVRSPNEQSLFNDVCRIMCEVVGYRMAWVGAVEQNETKSVRPVAWYGEDNGYLAKSKVSWADSELGNGPTGSAARNGKTDFCQDFATDPRAVPWRDEALSRGFHSSIAIPLFDNTGSVFAVFTLYSTDVKGFTTAEVRLLEELAGDLAFGIIVLRAKEEQIKIEKSLKDSEEKYRNLFISMNEGFGLHEIVLDAEEKPCDYRFLELNDAFEKLTGLSREKCVGRTAKEVLPDIEPYWIETYGRVAQKGEQIKFENYSAPLKKWYEVYAYSPGKNRFAAVFMDITERKQGEEAIKRYATELEIANRELQSFSYTVSHDLRGPLRIMDGYSQALLEDYADKLDNQGKTWMNNIRDSCRHMGQLIDDILGLSRVVWVELKFERVNLSEIAQSIAIKLKEIEPSRQVEFIVMPGMEVLGDNHLLGLALQNLLGNAFKFTVGCQFARIEFGSRQQNGRRVYFVRDNGAGFEMKYIDKLFKPFQRLHSSKNFPGTGIGLVTVQRIIQRHGGEVWAEGAIDKGATFHFTLNQERPDK